MKINTSIPTWLHSAPITIYERTWTRTEIAPFKSESLAVWWQYQLTSSTTDTKNAYLGAKGAPGPCFLSQAPSQDSSSPISTVCWSTRASKDLAPCEVIWLWPRTLASVYCWGFCNVFTVLIKTEARTQGPLYTRSIHNNGSPALFTLDKANWMTPLSGRDTPVLFPGIHKTLSI